MHKGYTVMQILWDPNLHVTLTPAHPRPAPEESSKQTVSQGLKPIHPDMQALLVNPWQYSAASEPPHSLCTPNFCRPSPSKHTNRHSLPLIHTHLKLEHASLPHALPHPQLWPPQLGEYSHGNSSHLHKILVCVCVHFLFLCLFSAHPSFTKYKVPNLVHTPQIKWIWI